MGGLYLSGFFNTFQFYSCIMIEWSVYYLFISNVGLCAQLLLRVIDLSVSSHVQFAQLRVQLPEDDVMT